jgi:small subunit ribosomal protein S20
MPNLKSQKKRMRSDEEKRVQNQGVRTRVKTARRKMMEATATGEAEVTTAAFREYCSVLDKAAKSGIVKKNTAVRRKARAAAKLREVSA